MEKHIRTTHVGSLPRSAKLTDLLIRQELGEVVDSAELELQISRGVHEVIRHQVEAGVDIVNVLSTPLVPVLSETTLVPYRITVLLPLANDCACRL